ncbi:hypothetical protein [Allocoleopsis sp.]|uniref:hypothetical protein n=1 Tax=Allocoleopsis sp. TaxID=3088169 RepID=UPI002FD01116
MAELSGNRLASNDNKGVSEVARKSHLRQRNWSEPRSQFLEALASGGCQDTKKRSRHRP